MLAGAPIRAVLSWFTTDCGNLGAHILLYLVFACSKRRQKLGTTSNYLILTWLRLACGINVRITGLENLPSGPCVILSNHQSAWESFYIQWLAQPASFVLKRELLWLPFFGWSVAAMRPIAIKRSKPTAAMRQVLKKGQARLTCGLKVVIYPEGTRNPSNELGSFKTGGAALAKLAGVDVVALAHNAGAYWPADSWLKLSWNYRCTYCPASGFVCLQRSRTGRKSSLLGVSPPRNNRALGWPTNPCRLITF